MKLRKFALLGTKLRVFQRKTHREESAVNVIICGNKDISERVNNNNRKIYYYLGEVVNRTDGSCGQDMVLYSDGKNFMVREKENFEENFSE